jgi:hypothetical protein
MPTIRTVGELIEALNGVPHDVPIYLESLDTGAIYHGITMELDFARKLTPGSSRFVREYTEDRGHPAVFFEP